MQIEIKGVKYEVVTAETVENVRAKGHVNTARSMEENGMAMRYVLKRPNGKSYYSANEFNGGVFSDPQRVS